jgi:multicomponent Na+:H+ antiporter subunit A
MIIFQTVLILVMIAAAVLAVRSKDLMNAVIACALVSLIASILFFFLHAPDVAMAEAAIGAGLTTAIFIFAINRTIRYEEDEEAD